MHRFEMNHYENVKALAAADEESELKIPAMKQGKSFESVCLAHCASDEMSCSGKSNGGAQVTEDEEIDQNEMNHYVRRRYSRKCPKYAFVTIGIIVVVVFIAVLFMPVETSVKSYHPCARDDNGGCQQLCLRSGNDTRSCSCRMGWQLNDDEHTCREIKDFVLYNQDKFARVKSIDAADATWPSYCNYSSVEVKGKIDFDYDSRNDDFYYSDDTHIYRKNLRNYDGNLDGKSRIILSINEANATIRDIAYDWYTGNMYFVQSYPDHRSLMMFNVNLGEEHRKTLMTYYDSSAPLYPCPYAMVLHPAEHTMFYGCWRFIQRATMNNTYTDEIHDSFPVFKHEYQIVAVDHERNRIYWIWHSDLVTMVKHSNFDGTDVRVISVNKVRNGRTIDVHGRWLYVGNSTSIWRVDKETGRGAVAILSDEKDIGGFKVFSEKVDYSGDVNECAEGNGGCQQFCLNGEDGPVCMCEDYMVARGFTCSRE